MSSVIRHVTVDCKDPYAVASFWGKVLDRPLHEDDNPGDPAALLLDPTGKGSAVLFISVPEGKPGEPRTDGTLSVGPPARHLSWKPTV